MEENCQRRVEIVTNKSHLEVTVSMTTDDGCTSAGRVSFTRKMSLISPCHAIKCNFLGRDGALTLHGVDQPILFVCFESLGTSSHYSPETSFRLEFRVCQRPDVIGLDFVTLWP